jgi:hypothetical protein
MNAWEYEVTVDDSEYAVVIADGWSVQSVSKIAAEFVRSGSKPRSVIWHSGMGKASPMKRAVSKAIKAARAIEAQHYDEDLPLRIAAVPGLKDAIATDDAASSRALEAAGVEFIPENGGGAGVRLRRPDHGRNQ